MRGVFIKGVASAAADHLFICRTVVVWFVCGLVGLGWADVTVFAAATATKELVTNRALADRSLLPPGEPLFRELEASRTGVDFQMQLPDMVTHDHELLHLSVLGGVCAGDIDGDGLADLYVTRPRGGNRLVPQPRAVPI